MYSFFTIFKKHGFKLWLANLVGSITTIILFLIFMFFFTIIATIFLVSSFLDLDFIDPDPLMILQPDFQSQITELIMKGGFAFLIMLLAFIAILVMSISLMMGGGIGISAEAVANNRSSIGSYFKYGLKSLGKMFGFFFINIIFLIIVVFILFLFVGFAFGDTPNTEALILIEVLFGLFLLVYLMTCLHAPVIAIVEQTGIFKSFSLSFRLLKNSFGKVLVTILYSLGVLFLSYLITLPFTPETTFEIYDMNDPYAYSDPSINIGSEIVISSILSFVLGPLEMALVSLIVVYRYFKYMRPKLRPDGFHGGGGYPNQPYSSPQQPVQPPFVFNPNQTNYPNNNPSPNPYSQPPNHQPPFYS